MIFTVILYIFYSLIWLLTLPIRVLDDVTVDSTITEAFLQANGYLSVGYSYLPKFLTALFLTWGIYLAVEVFIFLYKGFMWIIRKIPGVN